MRPNIIGAISVAYTCVLKLHRLDICVQILNVYCFKMNQKITSINCVKDLYLSASFFLYISESFLHLFRYLFMLKYYSFAKQNN